MLVCTEIAQANESLNMKFTACCKEKAIAEGPCSVREPDNNHRANLGVEMSNELCLYLSLRKCCMQLTLILNNLRGIPSEPNHCEEVVKRGENPSRSIALVDSLRRTQFAMFSSTIHPYYMYYGSSSFFLPIIIKKTNLYNGERSQVRLTGEDFGRDMVKYARTIITNQRLTGAIKHLLCSRLTHSSRMSNGHDIGEQERTANNDSRLVPLQVAWSWSDKLMKTPFVGILAFSFINLPTSYLLLLFICFFFRTYVANSKPQLSNISENTIDGRTDHSNDPPHPCNQCQYMCLDAIHPGLERLRNTATKWPFIPDTLYETSCGVNYHVSE